MTVEQTPALAAELDALEIDSPELRALAVRDYIAEQEQVITRQINAVFLVAGFLDAVEANAFRRGEKPVTCVGNDPCTCAALAVPVEFICCSRAWGPKLIVADYLTARSTVLAQYKGKAHDRALEIIDPYVPPALRVSEKHRVRG